MTATSASSRISLRDTTAALTSEVKRALLALMDATVQSWEKRVHVLLRELQ